MEFGGLVIAAAIAIVLAIIPQLVARRTAITESREIDRFSPRLRLLHTKTSDEDGSCETTSPALLPAARRIRPTTGEMMVQHQARARGSAREIHTANTAVRAIAKLRSERAARLSREAAAGQRRMVLSAVFAVVTIGLSLAAGLGALAWPWIILGAVPLAGVLVWSRGAAIASERASHAEVARLRELRKAAGRATAGPRTVEGRQDPRTHTIMPQRTSVAGSSYPGGMGGAAGVGTAAGAATAAPAMPAAAASTAGLGLTEEIARLGALARRENMAVAAGAEGVQVETVAETVAAYPQPEAVAVEPVRTESMTWSVTPVPAPTYARRGRVAGRQVHADTDIRGIPKVEARVPARPVRAQDPATGALSTHEVVADQMVALDLEAILESRRAQ